jgi:phage shock protein A
MSIEVSTAKHAIHDKLESQIEAAKAKLDTLKARAEVAKANVEIRAIADLATQRLEIHEKLQELKKSGDDKWGQAKKDLEARVAAFERSVKGIEAKVKALNSTPATPCK